jgi:Single-strand binding protein family
MVFAARTSCNLKLQPFSCVRILSNPPISLPAHFTDRNSKAIVPSRLSSAPRGRTQHMSAGEPALFHIINFATLVGLLVLTQQRQAKGNGSKFTVLSVATQHSWKNAADGRPSKTDWHRLVVFRPRLAVHVAATVKKGAYLW